MSAPNGATPASASPSRPALRSISVGTAGSRAPTIPTPLPHLETLHADLLDARGLDADLCRRLGIVSANVPGGGDWISFPFVKNGKVVNHKFRRLDTKDFRQDKGGEQCWWNHDCLLDPELKNLPLIVTEGEADSLAAMQCGYRKVVSVPGGAPDRPLAGDGAKYAFLADTLPLLRDTRSIVLATDGDRPGIALMNDLAARLGKGRCRFVRYPEGCKDLNDVLLAHGPAAVVEAINKSEWVKVSGLFLMSQLPPVDDAEPHATDMPGMAEHYNIRLADFCVITGIPGHGKTVFVNDMICRTVEKHDWRACFGSFEQHPQIDHRRALIKWKMGCPEHSLTHAEVIAVHRWIDRRFSFVIPDEDEDSTLDWLLDKLAAAVVRYGAEICVIDPWNELDHARPKDMTTTEYVGQSIREIKKFARRWNTHMIVVAHPTKMSRGNDGKLPMPTLYDISDSAAWFNKADVGVIIHRDGMETLVKVAKSRYHDSIGKPGLVAMRFNEFDGKFQAAGGFCPQPPAS